MDCFFVDGAVKSFADIILQQKVSGRECLVASYGFGVLQVRKVLSAFDSVVLVADISHAQLNADAYNMVVEMSRLIPNFSFIPIKTHAKLALIDGEKIIFTSANLSANRRIESYMIGSFDEITGIEKFKSIFTGQVVNCSHKEKPANCQFKIVRSKYFDIGGLNEARYTHVVDDRGQCRNANK